MRTVRAWIAGLVMASLAAGVVAGAHAQSPPIKIGQVVPLSGGSAAVNGRFMKQGAELAVEMINAGGGINGRPLALVHADDQSTNPGAVAALQKLLEGKEIPMILGPIFSAQVQAMLPTINEAKIPVAIGGTNYGLTHSGSQWVFRFRPHDGMSAKVIAKFMVEELKLKKVGIVHGSDAFGNGGRDMLVPAVKALGGEVVFVQEIAVRIRDLEVLPGRPPVRGTHHPLTVIGCNRSNIEIAVPADRRRRIALIAVARGGLVESGPCKAAVC